MRQPRLRTLPVALAFCCALPSDSAFAQSLDRAPRSVRPILELEIRSPAPASWEFSRVRDLEVDRNGTIYVLDEDDQVIRSFSATGTRLKLIGRRGGGPGEIQGGKRLLLRRDALWVVDQENNRITGFPLAGGTPRAIRIPVVNGDLSTVVDVGSKGLWLLARGRAVGGFSGDAVDRPVVHCDDTGGACNTLLPRPNRLRDLAYTAMMERAPAGARPARVTTRQPLSFDPLWAADGTGDGLIVVDRRPFGEFGNAVRLRALDARGDTTWTRLFRHAPIPVTGVDVKLLVDSMAKPPIRFGKNRLVGDRAMIRDSLWRPQYWPAVSALLVGIDGTIWLRQAGPPAPTARFWQLSASGDKVEAQVELPRGFTLVRASRTHLWGWSLDEDEVPIVQRWRVPR